MKCFLFLFLFKLISVFQTAKSKYDVYFSRPKIIDNPEKGIFRISYRFSELN